MAKKEKPVVKAADVKAEKIALTAIAEDDTVVAKPPKAKTAAPAPKKPVMTAIVPEKPTVPMTTTGKLDFTACEAQSLQETQNSMFRDPNIEILSQYLKK